MKVVELSGETAVCGRCQRVDGAQFTFDHRQADGVTVVLCAQHGWKEEVEFMHDCSTKWGTYLLSLKSLCETGKGTPYPDDVEIG